MNCKKIERVVASYVGAEVISIMYFIKEIFKQMYGNVAGVIPCLVLTDLKDLYGSVNNIKNAQNKWLISDLHQLKQVIAIDNIITEVGLVPCTEIVADSLTKGSLNVDELSNVVRCSFLNVPGYSSIISSMKINTFTWQKLI